MESAVYARQSVEKKNSLSIEGQIQLCENAAGTALKIYCDRGYSGKNTDRPAFQRLMKDVQDGKISKLFVYRLDRFSRSIADFSRLWEILQRHHVEFVSVNENFDTTTPMGRAMLHIIMVFAQLERETTAERVRDNYYRRASFGAWPGGPAPYGFTIGRASNCEGTKIPTLFVDENASSILRIFEEYTLEGASLGSVARKMNQEGIPAPRRDTWDNVALSRILHNPVYVMADEQVYLHYQALGIHVTSPPEAFDGVHGVLLVGKRNRSQKGAERDQSPTASILNSHGFVSSGLWLRCQNKLVHNKQIGNSGKGTHTWLSGLLKCAECGYSLKVLEDTHTRYLICSGRYNLARCQAEISISLTELEHLVAKEIEHLLEECPTKAANPQQDEVTLRQLEDLDHRADRLVEAFAESDLPSAYLQRALAHLEKDRQALLEAQRRNSNRQTLPDKLVFSRLCFEEKKIVAAQFINRIDLKGNSAEIHWSV